MPLPRKAERKEKGQLTAAGDYAIGMDDDGYGIIYFICPHDGCGDRCHLMISPPPQPGQDRTPGAGWQWNEEKKTLSPSIQRLDKERCHHHFSLIDGMWVP